MPPTFAKVFNGRRFAAGLVIGTAKDYARQIYDALGENRLRWMIQKERPLSDYLGQRELAAIFGLDEEQLEQLRATWGWSVRAISDKEFREEVLPPELQKLITAEGERGERWCQGLTSWLRKEIGG